MPEQVPSEIDALIVGAGFAGLHSIYQLRAAGLTVRAVEAGDGVGGTWFWNTYPGARCDIESMEYSYSFSEDLQQEWVWSQRYPVQPEIIAYANHVADRFSLREHITFETRVTDAILDEETGRWQVRTDRGEVISAQFLVMATGCLSAARIPDFPGGNSFAGTTLHTGKWPRDGVDFTGRRVAVIGTGSSGIQVIPLVAQQAAELTVFQRTANYAVPVYNSPLDDEEQARIKNDYVRLRQIARESPAGLTVSMGTESALAVTDVERNRTFEQRLDTGGFGFLASYNDILVNREANELAAQFVRDRITRIVDDPATAAVLTPTDHPIGTKRICLETNYFPVFNQPNVKLVDVKEVPISALTSTGLIHDGIEYEFDTIIFATGFDAMTGALDAVNIHGAGGTSLREKWAAGPRTYLGIATEGFPNLFMITGPGSPSVLSNMIVSIEQHVDWMTACVKYLSDHGFRAIQPTNQAEDEWVEHVNFIAAQTLLLGTNSWYLGANVPGKPRVFMPYAGGVGAYRELCQQIADAGYKGFALAR
ncbi:MAG: cyclohexanone monooxygenase [Pseudonocardiales bacterium]|nr:cyclohexanone monooxygenase [Pseudonocardiales bacterium]